MNNDKEEREEKVQEMNQDNKGVKSKEVDTTDEFEKKYLEDTNLGFGIGKCVKYLLEHGGLDDGQSDDDDDIDLDRVDEYGNKLTPEEQYKIICHRFHNKNPGKNKIKKQNKLRMQKINQMKMTSNDTPLNTTKTALDILKNNAIPFINVNYLNKKN